MANTASATTTNGIRNAVPPGKTSLLTTTHGSGPTDADSSGARQHPLGGGCQSGPVLPHHVVTEAPERRGDLGRRPRVGHLELAGGLLGMFVAARFGVRSGARVRDPHPEHAVPQCGSLS